MTVARYAFVSLVCAALVMSAGCGSGSDDSATQASSTPTPTPTPAVTTQFDPQWMTLKPAQPNGWEELNRTITGEFQQFDFRPVDETEQRRRCNGCAPWTATLTAYAPGKFDPAEARAAQPVGVNGVDDGLHRPADPADDTVDAMVAWQYADNAWATAVGMTTATSGVERLTALARALQPTRRAPIRLPFALANLPEGMPLAQIGIDTHPEVDGSLDYGTSVDFGSCGFTDEGAARDCLTAAPRLSVDIRPGGPTGDPGVSVPVKIGGREGTYSDTLHEAHVQIAPDLHAEFNLTVADSGQPYIDQLTDVLADVSWATDPADESTWTPVGEWAK